MNIEGKVIKIMPERSGQGQNGAWFSRDFVIETGGDYPKKVCFNAFGDMVQDVKDLKVNDSVIVYFNAESREYNERWYTNLKAWKIDVSGTEQNIPEQDIQDVSSEDEDDLPF